MRSFVSTPGRSSAGRAPEQSTIADSMPSRAAPPSSTSSSAPNSSTTCAAVVGLIRPNRFALGAATPGTPAARAATSSACATGWAGQRRPIVAWPAAAASATPGVRRTMTVTGPGQNASIRHSASGDKSAK